MIENDYEREQRWAQTERLIVKRYVSPLLLGFLIFCGLMFLPWVLLIGVCILYQAVSHPLVGLAALAVAGLIWYVHRRNKTTGKKPGGKER